MSWDLTNSESLDALITVLMLALILSSVGLIETLMTLSLIDEITQTRGQGNRESVAQGSGNILSGLFGGMCGCAMIGQSMVCFKLRRTRACCRYCYRFIYAGIYFVFSKLN
ncbi:SulP family inorganic anion transporter [Pseudoalteromonas sp. Hal099]